MSVLAFSAHAGVRVAEVGFLLILIAGIWLTVAEQFQSWRHFRRTVAYVLLAVSGALLIVAVHWGHFG